MDCSNRPFWDEFIELYRQNGCLWDVKSKDYTNKMKRHTGYGILLEKLRESIPGATLETLKKKINNIRTSFRRELKKVQDSKVSGNVYQPMLWYYNPLSFIAPSEAARKEKFDDDDDDYGADVAELVGTNDINFLDIQEEDLKIEPNSPDAIAGTSGAAQEDICQNNYDAPSSLVFSNTLSCRKRRNISNKFNSFKQKKFAFYHPLPRLSEDDEQAVTGKKFAFQLKRMDDHQRLIAEKLISDVMFYGGIGKLTENVIIQIPAHQDQEYCFNNSNNTCI